MKKFLKWFKSEAKIKRWILLILIGIVLVCYGVAKIIVTQELSVQTLIYIVISFTIGFTFTILGIVCIQKRTLELLVQESDTRNIEPKSNVSSLIFNKKVYNQGPKVVVIGGGAGLNTVLKGLKNYTDNITAIVTVSDYGAEKATKGTKAAKANPMDDIKDSLIALSLNEDRMSKLLNLKLEENTNNKDIKFSDLYFSAMEHVVGNFAKSVEESKNIFNITGRVLPVTLDSIKICAELEDGTIVESKDKIPQVVNEKVSKINRVYISPTNCRVAPGVIEAIREADSIVIGPGSLYTNVIPNLLVPGVSKAIKESKAFKIYVSNIMTEFGQTDDYSLSNHIKAILDHAGKGIIDYCIYDTGEIVPEYIRKYNKEGCELVEQDVSNVKGLGIKLIQRNLSIIENGAIRHNSDAIATAIVQLICDDLKFNDMQNNAQFMMLDTRIKKTNKMLKSQQKERTRENKSKKVQSNSKKTSKFYEKYNDRIISIKESSNPKNVNKRKNSEIQPSKRKQNEEDVRESVKKQNSKTTKANKNLKSDVKNNKEVKSKIEDINANKDILEILEKMRK